MLSDWWAISYLVLIPIFSLLNMLRAEELQNLSRGWCRWTPAWLSAYFIIFSLLMFCLTEAPSVLMFALPFSVGETLILYGVVRVLQTEQGVIKQLAETLLTFSRSIIWLIFAMLIDQVNYVWWPFVVLAFLAPPVELIGRRQYTNPADITLPDRVFGGLLGLACCLSVWLTYLW